MKAVLTFPRQKLGAALFVSLALSVPAGLYVSPAAASDQVGILECNVAPGVGFIVGASRALACRFKPVEGPQQFYYGTINQFGLNLGFTDGGRLVWTVFAASNAWHHALDGRYVGASADASVGAGVGANVLVGGSHRTVSLQPLSVSAQTGLNVAAGVGELTLEPAPPPHG